MPSEPRTTVCVYCRRSHKIERYSGHVIINGEYVSAGWCLSCVRYAAPEYGFRGHMASNSKVER